MTSKVVFKLCLLICHIYQGLSFQPEFVRSFLTRPWMLTNHSLTDPVPNKPLSQATGTVLQKSFCSKNKTEHVQTSKPRAEMKILQYLYSME